MIKRFFKKKEVYNEELNKKDYNEDLKKSTIIIKKMLEKDYQIGHLFFYKDLVLPIERKVRVLILDNSLDVIDDEEALNEFLEACEELKRKIFEGLDRNSIDWILS